VDRWDRFGLLDRVAAGQYGLVTLDQLGECGFSARNVRYLVDTGRLTVARRAVYRVCGGRVTWRSAVLAAVLTAAGDAVCSHGTAAVLWGLAGAGDHPAAGPAIEITSDRLCRQPGIVTHRATLGSSERARRHSIPVTTVERTIVDLADRHDAEGLGGLIDQALRRRLTTVGALSGAVDRAVLVDRAGGGDRRGAGRRRLEPVRRALAHRGAGYDPGANAWEQEMDRKWDEWGLPPAERQYTIRAGGRRFRPDRAIVDLRVAVDWNGREFHGTRSGFDADSERRSRLSAAGWHPLDFTYRSSPDLICSTVLAVCAQRATLSAHKASRRVVDGRPVTGRPT
jgi:hypothetical protein